MKDKQIILMTRGLPGSGKSTYAKQLVSEEPDRWVRVNKDSLRDMFHDGVWSKGRESIVINLQRELVKSALVDGKSVIVDDTNFAEKHENYYRELAETEGVKFELVEFDTSVEECIKRDLLRPKPVGKDVILRMYHQNLKADSLPANDGPSAAIFDLDGTLALMRNRGPFDWTKVGQDALNLPVYRMLLKTQKSGSLILIVSGRDGCCVDETTKWLVSNGVPFDKLLMRDPGNHEKDTVIKRRIWDEHIKGKYNVEAVFDDRPCVVRMWKSLGLFVFNCGDGYEF